MRLHAFSGSTHTKFESHVELVDLVGHSERTWDLINSNRGRHSKRRGWGENLCHYDEKLAKEYDALMAERHRWQKDWEKRLEKVEKKARKVDPDRERREARAAADKDEQ
jgi:hypothetical protein